MDLNLWWFYVLTCVVADLTPGPAVMLVVSNAAKYGSRRTIATICGSLLANILYFAICATSLGVLLFSSTTLFSAVKWFGAGYLVYLGIRSLISRGSALVVPTDTAPADKSVVRLGMEAVLLQLSNPKALLWFGAIASIHRSAARCRFPNRDPRGDGDDDGIPHPAGLRVPGGTHRDARAKVRHVDQPHLRFIPDRRRRRPHYDATRLIAAPPAIRDSEIQSSTLWSLAPDRTQCAAC